jgi:hypothetical protein
MRAPVDTIPAPPFLAHLRWVNSKPLRMERLYGRPVLVEFWDFCRPNSMRTLPYVKAWHERYAQTLARKSGEQPAPDDERHAPSHEQPTPGHEQPAAPREQPAPGLQVIGIHSPGFEPARERAAAQAAVARLGIEYPVLLDPDLEMWQVYENEGWPARYLFDARGALFEYHYGEGAYEETERAIQELLGVEREPLPPLRPEDDPNALLVAQTEDQPGAYSGPYEAGGVWAVLEGRGIARANGRELEVTHPGAYALVEHERHTAGKLELEIGAGVACHATCFTPGLA